MPPRNRTGLNTLISRVLGQTPSPSIPQPPVETPTLGGELIDSGGEAGIPTRDERASPEDDDDRGVGRYKSYVGYPSFEDLNRPRDCTGEK